MTTGERVIPDSTLRAKRCLRALSIIAVVGGCAVQSSGSGSGRASTLVVLVPNKDEWVFGPAQADESQFLMFLPLMRRGLSGEIVGQLIQSWEHSADYRHWAIRLRTDVRWHDGVPVTAHDVAFTVDLLTHPAIGRIAPGGGVVTVVDDSTYTVDLVTSGYRGATPVGGHWFFVLPKHLLEDLDPARFFEWEFWLQPVGNGPYRYVRHTPQTMVELEANPDFYLGPPPIERVVLKFSGENRLTELMSGSVDFALYVEWADLLKLEDDPRFRSYWTKDDGMFMGILWNVRAGVLSDSRVRRALTMGIDRRELYRTLNLPAETPPIESVFTERQYWRGQVPEQVPYDPETARALLERAGWTRAADGMWTREGESLAFAALVDLEDAIIQTAAVYVQDQLRDLGVRMELVPVDPSVWIARVRTGDFEATVGEVGTSPRSLEREFGSESTLGYRNERAAELAARANRVLDPEEKDAIYSELGAILRRDLPMTALFPDYEMHVAHRRVRGLLSPWRAVPLRNMEEVWLENDDGRDR